MLQLALACRLYLFRACTSLPRRIAPETAGHFTRGHDELSCKLVVSGWCLEQTWSVLTTAHEPLTTVYSGRVAKLSGYVQGDQIIGTLLAWQAFDVRLGHGLTQQGQQFSACVESILLNAAPLEHPRDGPVDDMEGCIGGEAKWWCKGIAP